MTMPLSESQQSAMGRVRPGRPVRRGRRVAAAALGALAALAILSSILIIAGVDSTAHAQDTQTEDAPPEDAPPEDAPPEDAPTGETPPEEAPPEEAPTEEAPPEDAPTGDGSDGPAPADDAAAGDSETAAHGRPGAPYSVTSGHHGCPHRPLSRYHDAVPSWSDWCLDRDYWIVEVTCRPPHAEAGRKVRFNADPAVVPELLLYDVCGNADPISECPPSDADPPGSQPGRDPGSGTPAADLAEAGEATSAFSDAIEEAFSPEELAETAADLFGLGDEAEDPGETIDAILESGEVAAETTAPADADGSNAAGDGAEERCGPLWPPGAWYQFTRQDPVTGEFVAGGQVTGSWFGAPHHSSSATPALVVTCTGGGIDVVVHTGGALVAVYGRGIPVEYRVANTAMYEEWNELDGPGAPRAGVSLPPWFTAGFVELLEANPEGELLLRALRHDGAAAGTATFDLVAIEAMMAPIRQLCPVRTAGVVDEN